MKTLLIMAAGNGSRYGALKQFDYLGASNEYLFEFSIYDAINSGFIHIVIVTKKQFVNDISLYLKSRLPKNIKIDVIAQNVEDLPIGMNKVFKREKPWGTAHAVWSARNYINNSFVVINADDFYGRDAFSKSFDFIESNLSNETFGIVPYTLKETLSDYGTVSRGICKVKNGLLLEINELTHIKLDNKIIFDLNSNTALTGEELTSMNFWICSPLIFDEIESRFIEFLNNKTDGNKGEIYIPLVIQSLIDKEIANIKLTEPSKSWFGVTYAEDKKNAKNILNKMTLNKKYPSPLWNN